jgi:tetratricopeptide (TPR) repeat protein
MKNLTHQADLYFHKGDYLRALPLYREILALNRSDIYSLDDVGLILFKLKDYTGAISYFNRTLTIAPEHENALVGESAVLIHLHKYTQALSLLDRAQIKSDGLCGLR